MKINKSHSVPLQVIKYFSKKKSDGTFTKIIQSALPKDHKTKPLKNTKAVVYNDLAQGALTSFITSAKWLGSKVKTQKIAHDVKSEKPWVVLKDSTKVPLKKKMKLTEKNIAFLYLPENAKTNWKNIVKTTGITERFAKQLLQSPKSEKDLPELTEKKIFKPDHTEETTFEEVFGEKAEKASEKTQSLLDKVKWYHWVMLSIAETIYQESKEDDPKISDQEAMIRDHHQSIYKKNADFLEKSDENFNSASQAIIAIKEKVLQSGGSDHEKEVACGQIDSILSALKSAHEKEVLQNIGKIKEGLLNKEDPTLISQEEKIFRNLAPMVVRILWSANLNTPLQKVLYIAAGTLHKIASSQDITEKGLEKAIHKAFGNIKLDRIDQELIEETLKRTLLTLGEHAVSSIPSNPFLSYALSKGYQALAPEMKYDKEQIKACLGKSEEMIQGLIDNIQKDTLERENDAFSLAQEILERLPTIQKKSLENPTLETHWDVSVAVISRLAKQYLKDFTHKKV